MKKAAPLISYLLHPLLMPTLGLLIILNSGTYLSLLDPAAKRAIVYVLVLGTLVFPLMMLPVLHYRNLLTKNGEIPAREEQLVPQIIILILYIITFVYFKRLPLSQVIDAYVLSVTGTFFIVLALNLKFRVSVYTAAPGGLTGLIIALIYMYETPLEGLLMLSLLAAGLSGSSRLAQGTHWSAVLSGFLVGLAVVLGTILLY
ncbi:MAG: hypothetical protein P1P86_01680 [Bacteroidales bacterium]|nr:hypothetical protein [Bacteroidales bacterium]